jgi:hypothetical protein
MRYYLYLPAALLALVVATWAFAAHWRPFKGPAIVLITMVLLAVPGYLFFYTGGM